MRWLKWLIPLMLLPLFIFLVFALPALSLSGNSIPYENPPFPESRWSEVHGVELHYRHFPKEDAKAAVLLIHGFCGSTYSWRNTIPELHHAGYEVLVVDLPAFGYSSRRRGLSHHNMVRGELLWKLIEQEGFKTNSWLLAGHSMGGGVVAVMATLQPEKTLGVVLVGGAIHPLNEGSAITRSFFRIPLFPFGMSGIVHTFFFRYKTVEKLLTSAYGIQPEQENVEQYLKPLQIKGTALAIMDLFNSGAARQKTEYEFGENLLLIWGKEDDWVPVESAYQIKKSYPQAELVLFENVAHNPMESHPELFNPVILEYLERLTASASTE